MDGWMDGCMDVWMYGCMDVCMSVCLYVCTSLCLYVSMFAISLCVSMCICIVYIYIYVCVYVYVYGYIYIYAYAYIIRYHYIEAYRSICKHSRSVWWPKWSDLSVSFLASLSCRRNWPPMPPGGWLSDGRMIGLSRLDLGSLDGILKLKYAGKVWWEDGKGFIFSSLAGSNLLGFGACLLSCQPGRRWQILLQSNHRCHEALRRLSWLRILRTTIAQGKNRSTSG